MTPESGAALQMYTIARSYNLLPSRSSFRNATFALPIPFTGIKPFASQSPWDGLQSMSIPRHATFSPAGHLTVGDDQV